MRLNEVTQRRLEVYERGLAKRAEGEKSAAAFNRIIVDAAREAGIAEELPDDLLDLSPRAVTALTKQVLAHVNKAKEPLSGE